MIMPSYQAAMSPGRLNCIFSLGARGIDTQMAPILGVRGADGVCRRPGTPVQPRFPVDLLPVGSAGTSAAGSPIQPATPPSSPAAPAPAPAAAASGAQPTASSPAASSSSSQMLWIAGGIGVLALLFLGSHH